MLKKAFLFRFALHELKKQPFSANQKLSIYRKLYALPPKASRFRNQNIACSNSFLLSSKTAFFTYKNLSFAQAVPCWFQNLPIFTNQKPFFCTNLSLLLSKAILFCPPLPISTPLNLLSTKEFGCSFDVRFNSLCCKAGRSHRFKSLPAIPGKLAFFRVAGYLMNAGRFRNNHGSTGDLNRPQSPEVRKPLVYFWFFSYTRKE